ncbi:MAG: 2Fe-2S iron-sulfur cluster binding domain-containing protein [Acidobacteria bacterium]|nr:2Fe-2S iron-sulfur cluster binding domain-containing protein [Acidobacteriota bacterium]MBK8147529.1 2Fe-2S iron-sulfur cluster binding domain-containing protein [Acidobacteriota bacterium]MBK8813932.1 2Fe-2S iron-sulfur cluster binding domain-containing protein [Acidobacteriota bacterium]
MTDKVESNGAVQLSDDEQALLTDLGESRRKFLGKVSATTFGVLAAQILAEQEILANFNVPEDALFAPVAEENAVKVTLSVNGAQKSLSLDSRVTLLDALREKLGLTGSKKGCDHGQCGACTVIVDGRRVLSCLTLAATCEGKTVTTIEGLANGDELHPLQAAFIKHDGFQCGYCTPGQICSAVAMLEEAKRGQISFVSDEIRAKARPLTLSDDEIRERMSGNLCRCGAYPNIVKAIREVHTGAAVAQTWEFVKEDKTDATV